MSRTWRSERKAEKKRVLSFFRDVTVQRLIYALSHEDFTSPFGPNLAQLCSKAAPIFNLAAGDRHGWHQIDSLGRLLNQAQDWDGKLCHLVKHFWAVKKYSENPELSRAKKRRIAKKLGLLGKPYYLGSLFSVSLDHIDINGMRINLRKVTRDPGKEITPYRELSEVDDGNAHTVNEQTGYHVVGEDISVIFYSDTYHGEIRLEMAVLRGICCTGEHAKHLLDWIYLVIVTACKERRNVRPKDAGAMVQVGLNLGPWHARVLGLAKSYKKNLDSSVMQAHDIDAVGALSLFWGLIQNFMPSEVVDETNHQLASYKLPQLTTRNLSPDGGYTVQIGEETAVFPMAERAPPEGYLTHGYEARAHTDDSYSPFTFTFCVDRRFDPTKAPKTSVEPAYNTRHASKNPPQPAVQGPPGGGSSFVDLQLGVVVRQARGTMMAIRPEGQHGTTKSYGMLNTGMSISFTERIAAAWDAANSGSISVEPFQSNIAPGQQ